MDNLQQASRKCAQLVANIDLQLGHLGILSIQANSRSQHYANDAVERAPRVKIVDAMRDATERSTSIVRDAAAVPKRSIIAHIIITVTPTVIDILGLGIILTLVLDLLPSKMSISLWIIVINRQS